jgi:hypothetical protein
MAVVIVTLQKNTVLPNDKKNKPEIKEGAVLNSLKEKNGKAVSSATDVLNLLKLCR